MREVAILRDLQCQSSQYKAIRAYLRMFGRAETQPAPFGFAVVLNGYANCATSGHGPVFEAEANTSYAQQTTQSCQKA